MCGIIGYTSKKERRLDNKLIGFLKQLEYRGYDSSGIAVLNNQKFEVLKSTGNIDVLKSKSTKPMIGTLGIGHTRWATHGKPSEENAHPFLCGDWVIVHNGIIENFMELKEKFGFSQNANDPNLKLTSQTDSEVVVKLLNMLDDGETKLDKIIVLMAVCKMLTGSFAFVCANKNFPETLFIAKRRSPLYICMDGKTGIVASDAICFSGKDFYSMEDGEFCTLECDDVKFYDINQNIVEKHLQKVLKDDENIQLNNFPHYMIKEIYEESDVVQRICDNMSTDFLEQMFSTCFKDKIDEIVFVGCGTSYHVALMAYNYALKCFPKQIRVTEDIASEYRYSDERITDRTLFVLISQSGETADMIAVCELAKRSGAKTIAVTNSIGSALSRMSDFTIPVYAGKEISVASTKAYIAQIISLYVCLNFVGGKFGMWGEDLMKVKDSLQSLKKEIKSQDLRIFDELSEEVSKTGKVFFIGRQNDYVTSLECSLKLKEVSYINSFAFPAGELKHGFLALVDDNTYVFVIATNPMLLDKTLSNAFETKSRGAKIVLLTTCGGNFDENAFDYVFKFPTIDKDLDFCLITRAMQYMSYRVSVIRGNNPDRPRNLAKSVTVE